MTKTLEEFDLGASTTAAAKITGDLDELPAFCDYPAGHGAHLRTASPVGQALATARHRAKVGPRTASESRTYASAVRLSS